MPSSVLPAHQPDLARGKLLYNIGGCISCHKPDPQQASADPALPSGGLPLKTPIGTLYAPNITPDVVSGIGGWSDIQFVNAMQRGLSPQGEHLIPAFPYTSYAAMPIEDVLDIKAYLMSLTKVSSPDKAPDVAALPVIRRGIGLWKWMGLDTKRWTPDPQQSESWNLGSYLVSGPGHCSECHTPRTIFMTSDNKRWLEGGPHPEGQGRVPSLHGLIERKRYTDENDLISALKDGELMGYEHISAGGMAAVQSNISKLPDEHVRAIADYLVSLK